MYNTKLIAYSAPPQKMTGFRLKEIFEPASMIGAPALLPSLMRTRAPEVVSTYKAMIKFDSISVSLDYLRNIIKGCDPRPEHR